MLDFLKSSEPVSQCTPPKFVPIQVLNEDEQKKLVADYIEKSKGFAFMINRCLDNKDVDGAFEKAADLAALLQTESFNPHNYYALYNVVAEALLNLSYQISDQQRFSNDQVCSQYETAQYHKGVIQRLYLMITVGPELAARGYTRVLDVLSDLAVMVKQSQNVIQSLFVRYYLLCVFKSHLSDTTPTDTERTVHFLLHNFAQMNRMWVRIADAQNESNIGLSEGGKSESIEVADSTENAQQGKAILSITEQRKELSVLVGMNLSRVTSLKNLTPEMYSSSILPFILKHVDLCQDPLAQEEILEFIIHAFPADFQILTIDQLFSVFGKVDQNVPILSIVNQLLGRFLEFSDEQLDPAVGKATFVTIAKNMEELFNSEGSLALINKFEVLEKLLRFALKVNSKDVRNIKNLFKFTDFQIDLTIGEEQLTSKDASSSLLSFIKCPFEEFSWNDEEDENSEESPLVILSQIDYLPNLIKRLLPEDRLIISTEICKILINSSVEITNLKEFTFVLQLTSSLVREGPGTSYFFAILTLVNAGSVENTMSIIQELANVMDSAFTEKAASNSILPIGFKVIRLMHDSEKDNLAKLVQFLVQFIKKNSERNPKACLQLCIEAARTLDKLEFGEEATQFVSTAINDYYPLLRTQYEDRSEKESLSALHSIFLYITNFVVSSANVDFESSINNQLCAIAASFATSSDSSSSRTESQVFAQDQIAVASFSNCANLFWRSDKRMNESKNVQACLAKACQIAANNKSLPSSLELLYSILSWATYFVESGCQIENKWFRALILLIKQKQNDMTQTGQSIEAAISASVRNFYLNTIKHIQENNLVEEGDAEEDEDDGEEDAEMNAEDGDDGEDAI